MDIAPRRSIGQRRLGQNYAFIVVGVIFFCLLVAAGQRGVSGVLIPKLSESFGWDRATVSSAFGLGIFCFGMVGPFGAALMQRFGIRRVVVGALILMALATGTSFFMTRPWQLIVLWGLLSGVGSGCVAPVLAATITARWFATRRGLVMGLLTASTATGTLIFLPGLAAIAGYFGWRPVVLTVAAGAAVMVPFVLWLLPESPSSIGLKRYGTPAGEKDPEPDRRHLIALAFGTLYRAARKPAFWLLFATFFVCGFTTNGLVGTHLISLCGDHGIAEVQAGGLLAMMGFFDLFGTTASGWLTDRYDPRKLLFVYYGLRGISLIYLPYSDFSFYELSIFAVFYGLDWIATVPPTLKLAIENFGDKDAPIVFGWIAAGHQVGAASATYFAGAMRDWQGNYLQAFVIAGGTGVLAAVLALMIGRHGHTPEHRLQPVPQAG
ncbi:MAG TPA: MFS transporter [Dongiaceae bacterium]|jgi:MFS family permease|nr:MFS transporter [Dongiaceae bacterium]